jgi:transcriptional regulator with XRE-family HTH domain
MDEPARFGGVLRQVREDCYLSLRGLSERINFNRGYIGKVEQGEKFPDRQFAELADRALGTGGTLLEAWEREAEHRHEAGRAGRLVVASARDSLRLIAEHEEHLDLADLDAATRRLAVAYLASTPVAMIEEGVTLRGEALRRLRARQYRPSELADLYLMIGRVQGVLAYAALDAGDPRTAMTHADAAWVCAERASDNELRIWVRGTQSLIARFGGHYERAAEYIVDGLNLVAPGTGRLRLLCGYAQCRANLGDSRGTNEALDLAAAERARLSTVDKMPGVFEFTVAKQRYYGGSSLIWLDGGMDARRAAREAEVAIGVWEAEPPTSRPLDDEALARVYQGTAHLQLGELDRAIAAVRPVLGLPQESRISWIRMRLGRFGRLMRLRYSGSPDAVGLDEEIRAFV